ncbi:MAG: TetR/AcrR family transcriptional regulator [Acidobacteria bacterium]|nr:TetR/AcrR family transcriptional regulator [Acidobacteriota bacterium]
MREKKLSRRERLKAGYCREILDAALELFTANGYHNVTMHQIAMKSEFSIGTLYNFFKNKEDLYHSLVLEKCKEYAGMQFRALQKDADVLERIREFLSNGIRFFLDNTSLIRIFIAETRGESFNLRSKLRNDARRVMNELDEKVASVMREGVQKKIFRRLDPVHLTLALQGLSEAFLFHWMDYPEAFPDGLQADMILDIFTRGSTAQTAAAGPAAGRG